MTMTRIFVGNIPFSASETDLKSIFERFGRVSSVRLATNVGNGNPRGFAFVSMPHFEDAEEAIVRLNGTTLAGRRLVVNEAKQRVASLRNPSPKGWDLL